MAKLLPILLALFGLLAGTGAGIFLRPTPEPEAETVEAPAPRPRAQQTGEFVRLSNQFIVPVVTDSRVGSMVVLSLSIEMPPGTTERVYAIEPRLRDAFLQVLFDHANAGGFGGTFTAASNMNALRDALREAARGQLPMAQDVLILDIVRQDS